MEYKINVKHPSCFDNEDGLIKINIQKYCGKLFINWINLPKSCTILNSGRTVKDVPSGQYLVELEDDKNFGNDKQQIHIDVQSPPELKIDFYRITQPQCYDNTGSLEVFFSGGTPPYTISYNKFLIQITDTYYKFDNIHNMTSGYIKIKDKNGCYVTTSNIDIIRNKPDIKVDIIEPSAFGRNDASAQLYLKNIEDPKIRWYKLPDKNKPINIGSMSMIKNLGAGDYSIKIVDNNDCEITKNFTIDQPLPTYVQYTTTPDYSIGTEYPYMTINNTYNTILIPYDNNKYAELLNITPSEVIRIKNKNTVKKYTIIDQPRKIIIDNKEFLAIYILPCYSPTISTQPLTLIYKTQEYQIGQGFDTKKKHPHLCMTFAILDNNYKYAFNNMDKCEILHNNNSIQTTITKIENKYNTYDIYTHNTILWLDVSDGHFLSQINKNLSSSILKCRSLQTKSIKKKGSIFLTIGGEYDRSLGVYNYDNTLYKYQILCYNEDKSYNSIYYTNQTLSIDSLDMGEYTIELNNYFMNYVNRERINSNKFTVKILPSDNRNLVPDYHNKLATFKMVPQNTTGLFINIPPYDRKCKLYNDQYELYLNSTYEIITNLQPDKYYLDIDNETKEIYITNKHMLTLSSLN